MSNGTHHEEPEGWDLGHPMPVKVLVATATALFVLTGLTVGVYYLDLGSADLSVAMVIATIKATLVCLFFMHLKHDTGINALAFIGAVLFAGLFLAVTLGDVDHYVSDIQEYTTVQQASE